MLVYATQRRQARSAQLFSCVLFLCAKRFHFLNVLFYFIFEANDAKPDESECVNELNKHCYITLSCYLEIQSYVVVSEQLSGSQESMSGKKVTSDHIKSN